MAELARVAVAIKPPATILGTVAAAGVVNYY